MNNQFSKFFYNRSTLLLLLYITLLSIVSVVNSEYITQFYADLIIPQLEIDDLKDDIVELFKPGIGQTIIAAGLGLLARLFLTTLLFFVCNNSINSMNRISLKDWYMIVIHGLSIYVFSAVLQCAISLVTKNANPLIFVEYTSLLFIHRWFEWLTPVSPLFLPLSMVDVFNILFIVFVAFKYSRTSGTPLFKSLKYSAIIYGSALLLVSVSFIFLLLIYK